MQEHDDLARLIVEGVFLFLTSVTGVLANIVALVIFVKPMVCGGNRNRKRKQTHIFYK